MYCVQSVQVFIEKLSVKLHLIMVHLIALILVSYCLMFVLKQNANFNGRTKLSNDRKNYSLLRQIVHTLFNYNFDHCKGARNKYKDKPPTNVINLSKTPLTADELELLSQDFLLSPHPHSINLSLTN